MSIGGIAVATADDDNGRGPFVGRFVDGHDHPFADELASRLAESLGLDEDEVADALEEVRDELDPRERPELEDGELPAPPTEEERQARQAELAAALAAALDVDTGRRRGRPWRRSAPTSRPSSRSGSPRRGRPRVDGLVERLDAAVEEGTLTEADKESVLKAYDEGVLDGPGLGRFAPFGHGPFGPRRTVRAATTTTPRADRVSGCTASSRHL